MANVDLTVQISLHAQKWYENAIRKYGEEFADAVVAREVQLHADNLNCFEKYAKFDSFQEFIGK